jgi:hypothetical protein
VDATGIGAVADLASTVISRLWPDKTEQERAQLAAALTIVQGQLDANRVEAASPSAFTSGWRPGVGWVCVAALAMQYVARPLVAWVGLVTGHPLPELPGIDGSLWELMLGMLGLGGLRSFEKVKGVSR